MFIKFLDHDLRYGIGHAKKRLIVTFIMFFFLSIYHFWTLRIFELTDPQYLESPVTTADYFLALIGGCGKVNLISGACRRCGSYSSYGCNLLLYIIRLQN